MRVAVNITIFVDVKRDMSDSSSSGDEGPLLKRLFAQLASPEQNSDKNRDKNEKLVARVSRAMAGHWEHATDLEKSIIFFTFTNEMACLRFNLVCKEKQEQIIMHVCFERKCPERYRKTMMSYCNRLNYLIPFGFFATDPKDGEIRYRHSVDVEGIVLEPDFISNIIKAGIGYTRKFYMPLQAIMWGSSLEAAIRLEDEI